MSVTVLGVRHHGPGSARAVAAALSELVPDAVLIEGPPEADPVAALAADPAMAPPVALLVYDPAQPSRASFYPFAEFSPEWVALRYAISAGAAVRFIDLPAAHALAEHGETGATDSGDLEAAPTLSQDPIGVLARTAGHDDPERWWEDVVEHQPSGTLERFAAVTGAMAALREAAEVELGPREARREAAMRRAIRQAERAGHERIAVICGAWHAPVLERSTFPPASHDDALLRGLPKVKTAATWIPWTNDRLALHSGYGAGVTSPGWYHHLFTLTDAGAPIARWLQRAATVLRAEGLDASPASVVEAVRLAEALGAVRARPLPGLSEVDDATLAVLCEGNELALELVRRRLVVGEVLGAVPDSTPMVPLMEDLARLQRSLRLKPEAAARIRELDLRKDLDLQRSQLLHRLDLLGVPWGETADHVRTTTGTFKESWQLVWQPDFPVRLIEASRYGSTIEAAAATLTLERGRAADGLPQLTVLVETALLAGLPVAVTQLMGVIAERAATDADLGRLMEALEPLARVQRYGSVRREDVSATSAVIDGLVVRICVGLPSAAGGLDDDAAAQLVGQIEAVDRAIALLDHDDHRAAWWGALGSTASAADAHPRVAARAIRLLLDAERIERVEVCRRMELALSRAAEAADAAAWLEGFLAGSGLVLLHDPELLTIVDTWVRDVPAQRFDDLLPILRRTFSAYPTGERRQIGEALRRRRAGAASGAGPAATAAPAVDLTRAEAALTTALELLG